MKRLWLHNALFGHVTFKLGMSLGLLFWLRKKKVSGAGCNEGASNGVSPVLN
jgi:hypothetical protein